MANTRLPSAGFRRPTSLLAGGIVPLVALGTGAPPSLAAESSPAGAEVAGNPLRVSLQPTDTCPQAGVDELEKAIEFVQGKAWAEKPGGVPLNIAPDVNACKVTPSVGKLRKTEEAALQAGAGPRLAIVHRSDFGRPSRVLLVLWVVFGGSGLIWMFRRYGRR